MSTNDYMKRYMADRYERRMQEARSFLGGRCAICGSIETLEFDHIDPSSKSFTIGSKAAGIAKDKFWNEVSKCQLLCRTCHELKSIKDSGKQVAKGTHGTISSYRYCRCSLCRAAKNELTKKHKIKAKSMKNASMVSMV
jgi:5-methylcytosine-specific restriction endonuclease McrA